MPPLSRASSKDLTGKGFPADLGKRKRRVMGRQIERRRSDNKEEERERQIPHRPSSSQGRRKKIKKN
ncbi:hypothetical protein GcC1_188053 [Golovinomyces cichoracearum]|uniref:Uncharacterized protein n=1 Tax=Golovinomyces cichoracearum TaxID=62708 RepID=A0A420HJL8_9PEZI|nr:hypothetical protein GcC1_188053 [Golovinomyces cichoracearum]